MRGIPIAAAWRRFRCALLGHRWAVYQRFIAGVPLNFPHRRCDRCGAQAGHVFAEWERK